MFEMIAGDILINTITLSKMKWKMLKLVEEFFARVGYCIKEGADSLLPKLPHGISRYSRDDPLLKWRRWGVD